MGVDLAGGALHSGYGELKMPTGLLSGNTFPRVEKQIQKSTLSFRLEAGFRSPLPTVLMESTNMDG